MTTLSGDPVSDIAPLQETIDSSYPTPPSTPEPDDEGDEADMPWTEETFTPSLAKPGRRPLFRN